MVLAVEAVPFQRTMGEYNVTSTNSSVDVKTILRNIKLRRESCTNIAASGLASPAYDDKLPPRSHTFATQPATGPSPGSVAAFEEPPEAFSGGDNVTNEVCGAACTDATDTVMGRRHRQDSTYRNPMSPSANSASGHHSNDNYLNEFNRGPVSPTSGRDPSTVPSLSPESRERSLSAALPLSKPPLGASPNAAAPPLFGASFLPSPSSLPLPSLPPPLNGLYGSGHEDARFTAAPAPVDATAEVTMLIPSASAPSSSHLAAALSSFGTSKSPLVQLPLKAISSSVPLGDGVSSTGYPPSLSAAAFKATYGNGNGNGNGNPEGSSTVATALHNTVWGSSSGWQTKDVLGSDGKGNLGGDGRGSGGGGGGLGSGGSSHCASPS
ncbi:hypothetical protein Vretimale_16094, partial [Volvox reticuliferus]